MLKGKQIKARIREVEAAIAYEEGVLSVHMKQQKEPDTCRAITHKIHTLNAVVATFKEVLNG